jgi:hypothetical protein
MTMVTRQIVGYNPDTQRVEFEFYIPPDRWISITRLIEPDANDPHYVYTYPLDISLTNDIMGLVGHSRVAQDLKYFLECEKSD